MGIIMRNLKFLTFDIATGLAPFPSNGIRTMAIPWLKNRNPVSTCGGGEQYVPLPIKPKWKDTNQWNVKVI